MMTPPASSYGGQPTPLLIENARIIDPSRGIDEHGTIIAIDGMIVEAGRRAHNQGRPAWATVIDGSGLIAAPGLVDMQVFTGEPGAEHRETLASASMAAATGGVTTMVTMPDTDPVIDDPALVDFIQRRARDTAVVNVHPMAALTKRLEGREMAEIGLLKEAGAVGFTNGRKPVRSAGVMRRLLTYARDFDVLVAHLQTAVATHPQAAVFLAAEFCQFRHYCELLLPEANQRLMYSRWGGSDFSIC